MAEADPLSVLQVSPHPWEARHEINELIFRTSARLAQRGHRVLIAAPSESRAAVREGRAAIKAAARRPETFFAKGAEPRFLAVGSGVPLPRGPRPRPGPVPVDATKSLELLLNHAPVDIVHVHDPFAPSLASAALRHSNSLNVGTFHEPTERILSTQVARPIVDIFFGRLDARTVTSQTTGDLLERYFKGTYESVALGADPLPRSDRAAGSLRILYCADEERGAMRLFMRALRKLPEELDWQATVWLPSPQEAPRMSRRLRERVEVLGPEDATLPELVARHDAVCAASGGPAPAPDIVRSALAGGAIPVVSRLPIYSELVGEGRYGLLFPAGDVETLTGQLQRLGSERSLRLSFRERAATTMTARGWDEVAGDFEGIYRRLAARRHDERGSPEMRRRLAGRRLIEVDLHMHTDHSPDCATPVEVLLETARDRGLGAIAITDHNEVSGAFAARDVAEQMGDIKVIVAEEVKTAEQGEVIGLFLTEKIPRGLTMAETIAEIRRQGGLVYVPHPFDRLHSVPDYEHLLDMVEEIDILEVFNPRVALTAFNEEAERFARKYRIVPGAGSDSHVAQGLGSVRIRIRDFEGPKEFLEAMRGADITRKHKNLVYVQTLKFLQTAGRPKAPKRSVPGAKAVRGGKPRRHGTGRAQSKS